MVLNNNSRKGRSPGKPAGQRLSESQRREISIRLKAVDKLIKDGNLDEAGLKLESVRVMDPRNGYVLALAERIEELRKAKENQRTVEQPKTSDESPGGNEIEPKVEAGYLKRLNEEVHKIEERLEAEYRGRFTEEVKKSEQRITEMMKEERERHDTEMAALIGDFEKEKENLLKELKKETRKLFEVEFKKADDSYRRILADDIRKTEEKSHAEISSLREKAIVELKEALAKKRGGLTDEEREAIVAETRKRTEDELQMRVAEELEKAKTALASETKVPEEKGMRIQVHAEEESETALKHAGGEIEAELSGFKKASEERYRKSVEEVQEASDKHLTEMRQDAPKSDVENESRPPEMQKEGGSDLDAKSEEQFAKKREHMDKLLGKEFDDIRKGVDWKDRSQKKKG